MNVKFIIIFSVCSLLFNSISAQDKMSKKEEKNTTQQAEAQYNDENYSKAAELFESLNKSNPNDIYYKMMKGVCYTFIDDKRAESIDILLEVKEENPEYTEIYFFIGRSYAVNKEYDQAIEYFNIYLEDPDLMQEDRSKALLYIKNCENAKSIDQDSVDVLITNIGAPINTVDEEYVPIITPDESIIIFTYRGEKSTGGRLDQYGNPSKNGEYREDIMISKKNVNGVWSEPKSIGSNINTKKHDASIAISNSGQKLFVYKSDDQNSGDIYLSKLESGTWSIPKRLEGDVNSNYWEGSASLSSDEQILYFTSERKGGFGGRDIYKAELLKNNVWGNIQNLGPTINTPLDEDDPFIHPDNKTLYFSSKGHNSIGGYDVFYSFDNDGVWDEPMNIGYPVNTIKDDRFYVLSADASTGYYSSSGKSNSLGGNDIYVVTPGHIGKQPVLALVIGVTRANDKETGAVVTAINEKDGKVANKTNSDEETGKFLLSLVPGNKYKIAIEIEGHETSYEYLDIESLETFVQVEKDFNSYTDDYLKKNDTIEKNKSEPSLQEELNNQLTKIRSLAKSDSTLTEKIDLNKKLTKVASTSTEKEPEVATTEKAAIAQTNADSATVEKISTTNQIIQGLSFKVEIAAVTDTNDFDLDYLRKYGKIESKKYPDGTIRYAFTGFNTLEEAEDFRNMLIEKETSTKDAFVTVFVFGKRKTVDEYTEEYTSAGLDDSDDPCAAYTMDGFTKFILKDVRNDKENYTRLLNMVGDICRPGLHFEVQIAAYKHPENFKYDQLLQFGQPKIRDYPDEITRFTQGKFETFKDGEILRQKVISAGIEDAWITAFYKGKRLLMTDLVKGNYGEEL
ncbi:MAG: hypothetical protein RJQ00_11815 [Vicingaceae bacterium]